jgi:aldose 1-epimerase
VRRRLVIRAGWCAVFAVSVACGMWGRSMAESQGSISSAPFGILKNGTAVELYTLRNTRGMEARIATYGGILTYLTAPDRSGKFADVVLGYDTLDDYIKSSPYFGSLVGRYANRVGGARFTLDGIQYALAANNGPNSLHGGNVGFDKVVWTVAKAAVGPDGPALTLTYRSPDGEEGYPGTLDVKAVYTLTDDNALRLEFTATTDKDTIVNLTNHSYFNLRGKGDILGDVLQIDADQFTPIDETLIPTGQISPVAGTPFDFRKPTPIGQRINQDDQQLRFGNGYDHNWVLHAASARDCVPTGIAKVCGLIRPAVRLNATVREPETGRVLEVLSDQPGLQFYSGNFLDGSLKSKDGGTYVFRSGFCLEAQHFPDSPNHPNFPSVVLRPGQTYHNTIVYRFRVQ